VSSASRTEIYRGFSLVLCLGLKGCLIARRLERFGTNFGCDVFVLHERKSMKITRVYKVVCDGCGTEMLFDKEVDKIPPHRSPYTPRGYREEHEADLTVSIACQQAGLVSEERCVEDHKQSDQRRLAEDKKKEDKMTEVVAKCSCDAAMLALSKSIVCNEVVVYEPFIERIIDSIEGAYFIVDFPNSMYGEFVNRCIAAVKASHVK
jgi:hypothetical protein